MSEPITLRRTGQPPLTFEGELIAKVGGKDQTGKPVSRWHELAVYRLSTGGYVLRIAYRTTWKGDLPGDWAYVLDSTRPAENVVALKAKLSSRLADIDAGTGFRGFPDKPHYYDRQAHLIADIRSRYLEQVGDLLNEPEFAEQYTPNKEVDK